MAALAGQGTAFTLPVAKLLCDAQILRHIVVRLCVSAQPFVEEQAKAVQSAPLTGAIPQHALHAHTRVKAGMGLGNAALLVSHCAELTPDRGLAHAIAQGVAEAQRP